MKRKLELRNYQVPASDFAMNNDLSVLGMAPNGGKTEVAIDVIDRFLKLFPNGRVLVLAHSTDILRTNFYDRLLGIKVSYTFSKTFDPNAQVHVSIPQNEGHIIKGKYDLVIVDEAHENYLEKQVQRIIKSVSPKKQLLLTGTPSKFIKKGGYNIYVLAANQIDEKYFSKLSVELVASNYNWSKELNNEYEINASYKFAKKDTEEALELVVMKLVERLQVGANAKQFNDPDFWINIKTKLSKIKPWRAVFNELKKTIIICRSIDQANDVGSILTKHGVDVLVSHSKNDSESENVKEFKNNKSKKRRVLIVVNRGRLGYSDDDLYNIIDMSGTHNPNMIYQIFSRVLRGDRSMQKLYLKVTTNEYGMMGFTKACVCAALMLTDHKYLSTFNGNNFRGIVIPVFKKRPPLPPPIPPEDILLPPPTKSSDKTLNYPDFNNDVIDLFRNIIHDLDQPATVYKLVTLSEVRNALSGRITYTEEDIFASARGEINLSQR
jgi:superfamily II DNA or RNA helicase